MSFNPFRRCRDGFPDQFRTKQQQEKGEAGARRRCRVQRRRIKNLEGREQTKESKLETVSTQKMGAEKGKVGSEENNQPPCSRCRGKSYLLA